MSGTLTYLGGVSVGAAIPGVEAALAVSLTDLQARIDALLAFTPLEVDFAAQLALAESIVAGIQANITAGIAPPSISAQIALIAGLLSALEAQLEIILQLKNLMLTGGIDAYAYDGDAASLGGELTAALATGLPSGGTGATHINALILATRLSATWTAMGGVFIA